MNGKSKYKSYGFRGKLWEEGEIAENITEAELLRPDIKHFCDSKTGLPLGTSSVNREKPGEEPPVNPPTQPGEEPPVTLFETEWRNQLKQCSKEQLREKLKAAGIEFHVNLSHEKLVDLCYQNKIKA